MCKEGAYSRCNKHEEGERSTQEGHCWNPCLKVLLLLDNMIGTTLIEL